MWAQPIFSSPTSRSCTSVFSFNALTHSARIQGKRKPAGLIAISLLIKCCFFICRIAQNQLVQVSVWNQPPGGASRYQYTNVLYTSGLFNCYTLAVGLNSVCNSDQGATFTASTNDPNLVNCTCPPGTAGCDPYVDLTKVIIFILSFLLIVLKCNLSYKSSDRIRLCTSLSALSLASSRT